MKKITENIHDFEVQPTHSPSKTARELYDNFLTFRNTFDNQILPDLKPYLALRLEQFPREIQDPPRMWLWKPSMVGRVKSL